MDHRQREYCRQPDGLGLERVRAESLVRLAQTGHPLPAEPAELAVLELEQEPVRVRWARVLAQALGPEQALVRSARESLGPAALARVLELGQVPVPAAVQEQAEESAARPVLEGELPVRARRLVRRERPGPAERGPARRERAFRCRN